MDGSKQSKSIENSETKEEFDDEDIWDVAVDSDTGANQAGIRENGCNGVEDCITGKEGIWNNPIWNKQNNNRRNQFSSAPVNIPVCNRILPKEKKNTENYLRKRHEMVADNDNSPDDEAEDFEGKMIPPHEIVAMQLGARNEITSFSPYQGIARTLKHRDAVWKMTGFIE